LFSCDWIPEDLTEDGTNKIENLEVMNKDLDPDDDERWVYKDGTFYENGKMNWDEAMKKVAELGNGWRLPTKEECLYILHPNEQKILNMSKEGDYWTRNEKGPESAYYFVFGFGKYSEFFPNLKHAKHSVRAVRDIKQP
jgi:hypothetical protein